MSQPIRLIVGLGNPGPEYEKTRHNVGQWFIKSLAACYRVEFKLNTSLLGRIAQIKTSEFQGFFLMPTTYMNCSGQAVQAVASYYKIPTSEILVTHDELDFPAGTARIKRDGGHGGHNGLRDLIQHLGASDFLRFRIGIGHPGSADRVHDYVLSAPSQSDRGLIERSLVDLEAALPMVLAGHEAEAIKNLHTKG